MPRLFIGLEMPDGVAGQLSALRGGIAGARWIDPDDYHVTLRFIGDIDPRLADDLVDALDGVRAKPVRLEFDGLSAFGGDKPHTVVARVKPSVALGDLQGELERRARRLGLAPEPRKFTPHVTLARLRHAKAQDVAGYLSIRPALSLPAFTADRVALFSARESVGGGPYRLETTFALT